MSEWKEIDSTWLLAKNGKIGLNDESKVPDEVINKIAGEMDEVQEMDGDYEVPEEYRTTISTIKPPTPKARRIDPNNIDDSSKMIDKYVKQNGSIVVPKGKSASEYKEELDGDNDGDSKMICG